ncbi:hypothetical protein LTR53_011717 [Teratosphaeriaceae sp. CCFEE 6253]|nr:hypothetical protein LTR53_011717 [Teratosphaeriaceae sp. CCFEE 6253]
MAARQYQYIADYTARFLGASLFGLGLHAEYDPFAAAQIFAGTHPQIVSTPRNALFVPILGGRNMSLGLGLLALSLTGQRRAAGILLACATLCCGVVDVWWCVAFGSEKALGHAVGAGIGGPLAWWLLQ